MLKTQRGRAGRPSPFPDTDLFDCIGTDACLVAEIGFDTAENEPSKIGQILKTNYQDWGGKIGKTENWGGLQVREGQARPPDAEQRVRLRPKLKVRDDRVEGLRAGLRRAGLLRLAAAEHAAPGGVLGWCLNRLRLEGEGRVGHF